MDVRQRGHRPRRLGGRRQGRLGLPGHAVHRDHGQPLPVRGRLHRVGPEREGRPGSGHRRLVRRRPGAGDHEARGHERGRGSAVHRRLHRRARRPGDCQRRRPADAQLAERAGQPQLRLRRQAAPARALRPGRGQGDDDPGLRTERTARHAGDPAHHHPHRPRQGRGRAGQSRRGARAGHREGAGQAGDAARQRPGAAGCGGEAHGRHPRTGRDPAGEPDRARHRPARLHHLGRALQLRQGGLPGGAGAQAGHGLAAAGADDPRLCRQR